MKIPDDVLGQLEHVEDMLQAQFDRVWGYLPPSPERDAIMWHILTAKKQLTEFRREHKNG